MVSLLFASSLFCELLVVCQPFTVCLIAGIKNALLVNVNYTFCEAQRHVKALNFHLPQGSFVTSMYDGYYYNSF